MSTVFDYVRLDNEPLTSGNLTPIDAAVLCLLSYLDFSDFPNKTPLSGLIGNEVEISDFTRAPETNMAFLLACEKSRRFAGLRLCHYDEDVDTTKIKQFAAVTFILNDGNLAVAFRGTDATLNGWQEDFSLSFMTVIPAQREAHDYLDMIGKRFETETIILMGHSKGGNLAQYAAMKQRASVARRITKIFNLDGPGFREDVIQSELFRETRQKVLKIVPEYSVIGMLLEDEARYAVVHADGQWLLQHDMFNWWVDLEQRDFSYLPAISSEARQVNRAIYGWLDGIPEAKRARITSSIFEVLKATECRNVYCVVESWRRHLLKVIAKYYEEDPDSRQLMRKSLATLVRSLRVTLNEPENANDAHAKTTLRKLLGKFTQKLKP